MKILLACLMCLVLTMSQAFAIPGGPFGGRGHVAVNGTYSGTFIPIVDPTVGLADNSLALFTMRIPQTGLATGTSAVFRNGLFYPGTIQGTADPNSANLTGIITGSFHTLAAIIAPDGTVIIIQRTYNGNGQFVNAKIVAKRNSFSTSSVRIKGQASLTYVNDNDDPVGDSGGPIEYTIFGFKQSFNTSG